MYIATIPNRKSPPAILLRESYREGDKIKTKTLANLSHLSGERIEALRKAFKGEFDLIDSAALSKSSDLAIPQIGKSFGTYFFLNQLAAESGIVSALGNSKMSSLALFLSLTKIVQPGGSRLGAVSFAKEHDLSILGLDQFDEDDLYEALDYLAMNQSKIEEKLYKLYLKTHTEAPKLVLYDVTSSYFEGDKNELAAYGYNRDKKAGKKQIVIGLLGDVEGEPIAIRVFEGNTSDTSTVTEQINILKTKFNISEVIFVGDRGMVKSKAQGDLNLEQYQYITALTDSQVRKLVAEKIVQTDFFDKKLWEVEAEGKRYILVKNDQIKAKEDNRVEDKISKLKALVLTRNEKVDKSKRAKAETGLKFFTGWIKRYKLDGFIKVLLKERALEIRIEEELKKESMLLNGCYVLVSDVKKEQMSKEEILSSYKSLQRIERDFRSLKTGFLEIRPIFVRKKDRTIGHVFVAFLALKILRLMERKLKASEMNISTEMALESLRKFAFLEYEIEDKKVTRLAKPNELQKQLFALVGAKLPDCRDKLQNVGSRVYC